MLCRADSGCVAEVSKHTCSLKAESPHDAHPTLKSPELLSSGIAGARCARDFYQEVTSLHLRLFLGIDFFLRLEGFTLEVMPGSSRFIDSQLNDSSLTTPATFLGLAPIGHTCVTFPPLSSFFGSLFAKLFNQNTLTAFHVAAAF